MVAIGLLQARGGVCTPEWDRTPVEGRETVVGMLRVTVRHHIGQGERLSAGT